MLRNSFRNFIKKPHSNLTTNAYLAEYTLHNKLTFPSYNLSNTTIQFIYVRVWTYT